MSIDHDYTDLVECEGEALIFIDVDGVDLKLPAAGGETYDFFGEGNACVYNATKRIPIKQLIGHLSFSASFIDVALARCAQLGITQGTDILQLQNWAPRTRYGPHFIGAGPSASLGVFTMHPRALPDNIDRDMRAHWTIRMAEDRGPRRRAALILEACPALTEEGRAMLQKLARGRDPGPLLAAVPMRLTERTLSGAEHVQHALRDPRYGVVLSIEELEPSPAQSPLGDPAGAEAIIAGFAALKGGTGVSAQEIFGRPILGSDKPILFAPAAAQTIREALAQGVTTPEAAVATLAAVRSYGVSGRKMVEYPLGQFPGELTSGGLRFVTHNCRVVAAFIDAAPTGG